MRTALLTDLHANREALSACLTHAQECGVARFVFLGDYIGYGAEPGWVIDTVMAMVERGAVAILGNHDAGLFDDNPDLNDSARTVLDWTRDQLSPRQVDFLRALPLTVEEGDRLFVHATASNPAGWDYVVDTETARRSLGATRQRETFCGHAHAPALFHLSVTGKIGAFAPVTGTELPLNPQRRWLAVIGSVGQPRDGLPAAAYAILDEERDALTFMRVPYDVERAAAKVRAAGLPEVLALRLLRGR
jgi:diadenosine tetraphosphatase ApaH/serine/threonine PP2A family protein phosphatase